MQRRGFDPSLRKMFPVEEIFLQLTWRSDSIPPNFLDESINRGLVCAHMHSIVGGVDAGNKNTLSMHHPRRRIVTTSMVGFKNGHTRKNLTQNGEPQRYSWDTQKKKKKKSVLTNS